MDTVSLQRWALVGVFGTCSGLYVALVLAAGIWPTRVAWSLQVLMALAMVAMAGPWDIHISPITYVLRFTAGALYFAYVALFAKGVGQTAYRGVMMAAMVLTAVTTPGRGLAGGGVPNATPVTPAWAVVPCGIAAAFFLGATLRWFFVVVQGPQRPFADMLMAAGLGVSFAALIT